MKAKNELTTRIHQAPLYSIPHPENTVHFIANAQQWQYCAARLRAAKIVGIDTETRPNFSGKRKAYPCSLLQLATRSADKKEEVFVLDLLALPAKLYNATLAELFLSKNVIKLGQSLFGDLKELTTSYPAASCFTVAKSVVEVNDLSISLAGAHQPISLQKLAFLYLNKRLTKTQQTSNWNRRPLSNSQLHYAACDALVLIHIYDELMKRLHPKIKLGVFRLETVTNVLDVNVEVAPKCNLCFAMFETSKLLKTHRQLCCKTALKLEICTTCDGKLLFTPVDMERHVARCGKDPSECNDVADRDDNDATGNGGNTHSDNASKEQIAKTTRKKKTQKKSKKKSKKNGATTAHLKTDGPTSQPLNTRSSILKASITQTEPTSGSPPSKRRRLNKPKNKSKPATTATLPAPHKAANALKRVRKMSEGTVLESDDLWSQISIDQEHN